MWLNFYFPLKWQKERNQKLLRKSNISSRAFEVKSLKSNRRKEKPLKTISSKRRAIKHTLNCYILPSCEKYNDEREQKICYEIAGFGMGSIDRKILSFPQAINKKVFFLMGRYREIVGLGTRAGLITAIL